MNLAIPRLASRCAASLMVCHKATTSGPKAAACASIAFVERGGLCGSSAQIVKGHHLVNVGGGQFDPLAHPALERQAN